MELFVGRVLKLAGDAIAIVTSLFVVSTLVVGWFDLQWPREFVFIEDASQYMLDRLGPGWWLLTIGVGAVLGVALNRAGRELLAKESNRHKHYR